MTREPERPDPEVLLARIKAEEQQTKGKLRIYLGAAPGVGKTYAMLQEAHRRKSRGTDVVIGFVETHGRPQTEAQIGDLEIVPPREVPYKGVTVREMDTEAVIARHPRVALVDELAHTNVPGSKHEKRYEDVLDLLEAGITVISTLNIQHIESLNDTVQAITGIPVHETVPDWVVDAAQQVELIDMAPEALIQRMKHGNIYPPAQADQALRHFFRAGNLTALREMALRATAKEVDEKLSRYMHEKAITGPWRTADRVMVAVDHHPVGKLLIRRGWRMASAMKAEIVVVYVEPVRTDRQPANVSEERQLRANLQLADELGATVVRLRGHVADELIHYAREHNVTYLVLGHPTHSRWREFLHGSVTNTILRAMPGVDVLVVAGPAAQAGHEQGGPQR
jgi:two-component system sensor histidine kinase KdpD